MHSLEVHGVLVRLTVINGEATRRESVYLLDKVVNWKQIKTLIECENRFV